MLDPRLGTGSSAKACIPESRHRKIIRSEVDSRCVELIIPSLLRVFATYVLNKDSGINDCESVCKAGRQYQALTNAMVAVRQRNV